MIIRDEKTGKFVSQKQVQEQEMTDAQRDAICYKSKLLNKYFDDYDELVAAEEEVRKAEEEKKAKAEARKLEASVVEDAFKELNATKKEYNTVLAEANKIYLAEVATAKKKYAEVLEGAEKKLAAADTKYNDALKAFQKAHPDGYHLTLKDGDNVVTLRNSGTSTADWMDFFNSLINIF